MTSWVARIAEEVVGMMLASAERARRLVPYGIEILEGRLAHRGDAVGHAGLGAVGPMAQGVDREIAAHLREVVGLHGDAEAREELVLLKRTTAESEQRVGVQLAWHGGCHEVGHKLCLVHDAVDVQGGVVEQLGGTVDGGVLDEPPAAREEEMEEQGKDQRDDEHDEKA